MMFEMSGIGVLAAFAAGAISFLSPCVLPLVPGYVSYVTGATLHSTETQRHAEPRYPALALSMLFVLGFGTVFVTLGASATALGQLLLQYRYETNIIGGAIITVFGLMMTGVLNLPWLQREFRFHMNIPGGRPAGAYVLGLAFAFGWTPCIGPILGAILTASTASATMGQGIALLTVYAAGLGLPFLLAAAFTESLTRRIRTIGRLGRRLYQLAGVVMIVMGIAMTTGQLTAFSYWLLETIPALGRIG
jgi:cytochrome c-type biogenesis protein